MPPPKPAKPTEAVDDPRHGPPVRPDSPGAMMMRSCGPSMLVDPPKPDADDCPPNPAPPCAVAFPPEPIPMPCPPEARDTEWEFEYAEALLVACDVDCVELFVAWVLLAHDFPIASMMHVNTN